MPDGAAWLCSAAAVRDRCAAMLGVAEAGGLGHMVVDAARLPAAADYVAAVIRRNYPNLAIPHHARWRHFLVGGVDRWGALRGTLGAMDAAEAARVRIDLCVASVLLDAGAGAAWRYREPGTGLELARSEGLAVASLDAFRAGLFSADGSARADAAGLGRVDAAALGRAFQVSEGNPLAGLEGRAALLRRLGAALAARPDLFGSGRAGRLFDALAGEGTVRAGAILEALLDGLGPIWPGRLVLDRPRPGRRVAAPGRAGRRAGAVPQAVAMAGLLADRGVRGRGRGGDGDRGADGAAGIPQRRAAAGPRRAAAAGARRWPRRRCRRGTRRWWNGGR